MNYSEHCQYSIRLIEKLKALDTKNVLDLELINKAIYWAKKYHGDQKRKSGELYYSHPLEVAYMISDYKLKTDVIVASILHDIIEDTPVTAGMILDNFGWRIAEMVDRLTRDRPDGSKLSVEKILENAYEMGDKEVLLIKLIDRLHNIQTIAFQSPEKRKKTVEQTLKKFTSLVMYYGVRQIELDLDRLCREYLVRTDVSQNVNQHHKIFSKDNVQILALAYKND
jgi:(p)ppGpp synthase/HD superfamily hydrolase